MEDPVALSRRSIVKAGFGAMGAAALAPLASCASVAPAKSVPVSETLVTTLYKSLSDDQRKLVCFPFDDRRRQEASGFANVDTTFSADQQEMIRQIFIRLHNPEYADKVMAQVVEDNRSFGNTNIALFGEPGSGKFEFVQNGQHLIRRCDGDSDRADKGAAFSAPIWYGHAAGAPDPGLIFVEPAGHPGDAYFYQARQASQLFKMLDGKQCTLALVDKDPGDGPHTVKLSGKTMGLPGIPMTELSRDQKDEVRKTLAAVLAPFRKADADEALKMVEANGFDHLHMAFYKSGGVDTDNVWNTWQIEGPMIHWYFKGEPHVHGWVNIRRSADV